MTARHILIVDDDRDLRETVRELLETHGHNASDVEDGAGALEVLRRERVCLVLLDWHISPMSAAELKAAMAAEAALADIPVVVVSGDTRVANETRADFAGWLTKPIDLVALFDLIEQHCS